MIPSKSRDHVFLSMPHFLNKQLRPLNITGYLFPCYKEDSKPVLLHNPADSPAYLLPIFIMIKSTGERNLVSRLNSGTVTVPRRIRLREIQQTSSVRLAQSI
jgi:hypothetical protein